MFPLFSLLPAVHDEQHSTTQHIPLQDCVEVQSVCSRFLSTLSFWLYYSPLSEARGTNKCIIGVIYLGGRAERIVYSWLHHSVRAPVSDRRSSTSCNAKTKCWNNPIWFTYRRRAAVTTLWQLLSVRHVADWQQVRKNTRERTGRLSVCRWFCLLLKSHQGQDICFFGVGPKIISDLQYNDFRPFYMVQFQPVENKSELDTMLWWDQTSCNTKLDQGRKISRDQWPLLQYLPPSSNLAQNTHRYTKCKQYQLVNNNRV